MKVWTSQYIMCSWLNFSVKVADIVLSQTLTQLVQALQVYSTHDYCCNYNNCAVTDRGIVEFKCGLHKFD